MDDQDEMSEREHAELIRHNAEFDRWEAMSEAERDQEIRATLKRS